MPSLCVAPPICNLKDAIEAEEKCQLIRLKLNWLTADEQDQSIVETLYELTDTHSISEFQQLDKRTMREALAIVKESGIAVLKLARLTGIPIGVIRYAKVKY